MPRKTPLLIALPGNAQLEKLTRNVHAIHYKDVREGWERWVLLSSDRHFDSAECDRDLMRAHLEMVKQRDALVLDGGDFFDCMQGRYDPRRSYPNMRSEYFEQLKRGKDYFQVIVEDAKNFAAPYAKHFAVIARGNHEMSIAKHNDVDLTDRLIATLNGAANTHIEPGEYGGWILFRFTIQGTQHESINLKYFHGGGGGNAPVTKGVIQTNRQAVYLPDADIVVGGHIHESWLVPVTRERVSANGVITQDYQYHVRTPTYKDDYGDGARGWHVERGAPPKPKGAVWLRFYYDRKHVRLSLIQELG